MSERWTPDSWRAKPVLQIPEYPDAKALADVEAQLATFPPLVFAGEAPVDLSWHCGRRIDQHGMTFGPAGQEQARRQQISVRGGKSDVVDENVVQRSHPDFPRAFARDPSKCEFDFCRKGLSWGPSLWETEFQLAVRGGPVYNPALRHFRPATQRLRRALQCWSAEALAKADK